MPSFSPTPRSSAWCYPAWRGPAPPFARGPHERGAGQGGGARNPDFHVRRFPLPSEFPELAADLPAILGMAANQVTHALVVSVNMPEWPGLMALVEPHAHLWASVGVHPTTKTRRIPPWKNWCACRPIPAWSPSARPAGLLPAVRAVGLAARALPPHIRAARETGLPLIVHTRASAEDTVRVLREKRW